ncbi:MAG: 3-phosphoshikimate 1-carboxyvinyltransferase [Mariprofundaceae bacterium]
MSARVLIAGPARSSLQGDLVLPGDKSISHRVTMLGSLAEGVTEVSGFLPGEDNLATLHMFRQMGIRTEWLNHDKTRLLIHGAGLHGLDEPENVLEAGNSGTCVRLMAGILAGQSFFSVVNGDASLRSRPMERVISPLRKMGAAIDGRDSAKKLPFTIRGGALQGIHFQSAVASAQVKSCVLFAALFAEGETSVTEPALSRDHTENLLPVFGQDVSVHGRTVSLFPGDILRAPDGCLAIPADPSSACFFAVASTLIARSSVRLRQVGVNPRRDGWRRILGSMGAKINLEEKALLGSEQVADIVVQAGNLGSITVEKTDIVDAIDEFPALFVAAALADGEFTLTGAEELRAKESDRIGTMATALNKMGVVVDQLEDGLRIQGRAELKGGVRIDACHDHRIAMAMSVAAQRADADIEIINAEAIATSFPDFVPMAQGLGMNVCWQ